MDRGILTMNKALLIKLALVAAFVAVMASACGKPGSNGGVICGAARITPATASFATEGTAMLAYAHRTPNGGDQEYAIVIRPLAGTSADNQTVLEVPASQKPDSLALLSSGDEVVYIRNNDLYRKKIGGSEVQLTSTANTAKRDVSLGQDGLLYFSMDKTTATPRSCGYMEYPYDCYPYGITDGHCCDIEVKAAIYHLSLEQGAQPVQETGLEQAGYELYQPQRRADGKKLAWQAVETADTSHSHLQEKQDDGAILTLKNDGVFHTIQHPVYLSADSADIYFIGGGNDNSRHGIYKTTSGDLKTATAVKVEAGTAYSELVAHPDGQKLIVGKRVEGDTSNPVNLHLCSLNFSDCSALTNDTAKKSENYSPAVTIYRSSSSGSDNSDNSDNTNNSASSDDCI